jgi:hypothetical protein
MLTLNNPRFAHVTFWTEWLFCVLASGAAASAQQPTSQVLTFTGSIPGQPDGPAAVRLRLYNANPGGVLVFEETQTVTVLSQTFTARIGDATADGVPATSFRDNSSLWIAFALDSAPDMEIGLRTAITSGGYAHAAAVLSSPMVRTVNGLVGDVTLAPGSNVTITPSGSTLTIDATTGLTNVAHDGTLIGNGTDGAPLGVAAPLALTSNQLLAPALSGSNTSSSGSGVFGRSNGGYGVTGFSVSNLGVRGESGGSGAGVYGTSASGEGVSGTTNGGVDVAGVKGEAFGAQGKGVWGVANVSQGMGVRGESTSGAGVSGSSPFGHGVEGFTAIDAGVLGSSGSGNGVQGESTNGIGVYGHSVNGFAVFGDSGSSYAGYFNGKVVINILGATGSMALCRNSQNEIAVCSSSLRYKTDVRSFAGGLDIVRRLRPIAFVWKQGGMQDVGLGAEDVEQVEPLLTFRNDQGDIEGVKYNQLSAVFVSAIQDQQDQIARQQKQITHQQRELAALKALVCKSHLDADPCR